MRISRATGRFDKRKYDAQDERKQKRREYRKSDDGQRAERKYRHDNSKWITDATYLSTDIVAVDGEGINIDGRCEIHGRQFCHHYILLAVSDTPPIINRDGLSTTEILDYLWTNLSSKKINVIYGGSYDFNCWVADLEADYVRALYKANYTSAPIPFGDYLLRWIKGKGFEITRRNRTVKIHDTISFFQKPFIGACDEYFGPDWEGREIIVREKARRGNFTADEIENISGYNNLELVLLVRLITELRIRLNRVGLRPRRWDGPGAIAASLFLREGIKKFRNENLPAAVAKAARYAYAGGRFELIQFGKTDEKVYEYDINSAYPAALQNVPSLVGGKWVHHIRKPDRSFPYALYRVRYEGRNQNVPGPIFYRAPNGTIAYPLVVENWIWSPEFETLREYCATVEGAKYSVIEAWEYQAPKGKRPFHFLESLYNKRQVLKAIGDGAHVGIKLALNSLYGKLAQQVGWVPATKSHPARIPTYHQLEWAGYVTSWCRASVLRAVLQNLHSVVAFETDAVFTTAPLNVSVEKGLGKWEQTIFDSLTYVQSGHYYGTTGGQEVTKCRGIDRGFISRAAVEQKLITAPETERYLEAALTRFYGAGIALVRGLAEYWRTWRTEPKLLFLGPSGKRVHGACTCDGPYLGVGLHQTFSPIYGGVSSEYPVAWINPDEAMIELTEMRESENDYESD